jgi:hypothetical protein
MDKTVSPKSPIQIYKKRNDDLEKFKKKWERKDSDSSKRTSGVGVNHSSPKPPFHGRSSRGNSTKDIIYKSNTKIPTCKVTNTSSKTPNSRAVSNNRMSKCVSPSQKDIMELKQMLEENHQSVKTESSRLMNTSDNSIPKTPNSVRTGGGMSYRKNHTYKPPMKSSECDRMYVKIHN